MKTLADLKRALIPGATLTLTFAQYQHKYIGTKRRITSAQSSGVYLEGGSFLQFPRAKELLIVHNPDKPDEKRFSITDENNDDKVLLSYILNQGEF